MFYHLLAISLIISICIEMLLALFVYLHGKTKLQNITFLIMSTSLSVWAYYSLAPLITSNVDLVDNMIKIYTFVIIENTAFYFFTKSLVRKKIRLTAIDLLILLLAILSMFLIIDGHVVSRVSSISAFKYEVGLSNLIIFFALHIILTIVFGFINLAQSKRGNIYSNKALNSVIYASALIWILAPFTHFIFVILTGSIIFVVFLPIIIVGYSITLFLAVLNHGLFDIKLIAIRSLSYLLSSISLAVFFVFLYTFAAKIILQDTPDSIYIISFIVFISWLLIPFYKFFELYIKKRFYKSHYTIEDKVEQINEKLLMAENIQDVLNLARDELIKTLYPSELFVQIKHNDDNITLGAVNRLSITKKVTVKSSSKTIGYIFLENKKDGNRYTRKDDIFLDILSNKIARKIEEIEYKNEIVNFNKILKKEVSQATKELQATNRELKRKDKEKDEFLSITSHQLRTPITSLKNYSAFLLKSKYGQLNSQQAGAVEIIKDVADKMAQTVNDLLASAQIDNSNLQIANDEVNLSKIVTEKINQHEPSARNIDIAIDSKIEDTEVYIIGDKLRIGEVMSNLIENAIQYSRPGGTIFIKLQEKNKEIEFTIEDEGEGVAEKDKKMIFKKFGRSDSATISRPEGTGLGLFIVKKIIEMHNGSIIFKSKFGVGSTFGFKLPLAPKK